MQVGQNVIKDMLGNIKDPKLREVYGSIISGKIVAQVHCMSKTCKGRVIAFIDETGKVDETDPELSPEGAYGLYSSGLEGSRQRLDGLLGFRCYCGNNSILCEEEKGIITPARPSQEALQKIAQRLGERKPNTYVPRNGKIKIDGFIVEEVKV